MWRKGQNERGRQFVTVNSQSDIFPGGVSEGRRDLRLDAFRGLALWFTFIDHVPNNMLSWLTIRNYGFSDASEVFVFVSGYTCMIAYGGALRKQGWSTTVVRGVRRAGEIYAALLLLLIAYLALVWLFGGGVRYLDETNTGPFFQSPGATLAHAAILQYVPVNADILPTFVLLHLAFPALLVLLMWRAGVALAASFLLYLLVQLFDWGVPTWPNGQLYFNPLAWQVLFVFGAWYAFEGAEYLRAFIRSRATLVIAVLYLAFSLALALSWQIKSLEAFVPDVLSKLIYPIDKGHFSPLRFVHFLALAILVARLTPADWSRLTQPSTTAAIRCGENALPIYCLSVLLSFFGSVILAEFSDTIAVQVAVSLIGIAAMIAAATAMTWTSKLDRPGPRLF
jgi:hypothetical protein